MLSAARSSTLPVVALFTLFMVALWAPLLVAQVVTDPPSAVPLAHEATDEWGGAMIWAFLMSSALEWIKRNRTLTFVTEQSAWLLQRALGLILAVATALGVHWSFDSTAGTLTVTGLLLPSMYELGKEALRQWVLQEVTYRVAIRNYRPTVTV